MLTLTCTLFLAYLTWRATAPSSFATPPEPASAKNSPGACCGGGAPGEPPYSHWYGK